MKWDEMKKKVEVSSWNMFFGLILFSICFNSLAQKRHKSCGSLKMNNIFNSKEKWVFMVHRQYQIAMNISIQSHEVFRFLVLNDEMSVTDMLIVFFEL